MCDNMITGVHICCDYDPLVACFRSVVFEGACHIAHKIVRSGPRVIDEPVWSPAG